jgi:hypothetical protein
VCLVSISAVVVAFGLLLAGCGGGDSKEAKDTLRRGFATSIGSANISIDITGKLDGIPQLSAPVRIRLAGPYSSNGSAKIPSLAWDVSIAGGGQTFSTAILSTGSRAFVNFQGTNYEVSPATVAGLNRQWSARRSGGRTFGALGLHPLDWVKNASMQGDSQIAGVTTTHVTAGLDVGKMLSDLNHLGGTVGSVTRTPQLTAHDISVAKKVVQNPRFDVYVGKADHKIRRIAASVEFKVPSGSQARVGGLKGGTLTIAVQLASVGQPQQIAAPKTARPISQLRQQLLGRLGNGLGGALGGGLGGTPGGGGSSSGGGAPNPKLQRYSQCLEKAKPSDTAALQRCSALLK